MTRGSRLIVIAAAMVQITSLPVTASPPDEIVLEGVARDFKRAHPDFDVSPLEGTGHCAGNLALTLPTSQLPDFTGAGYLVGAEWTNAAGQPIAPHLYGVGGPAGGIFTVNAPNVDGTATVDTWDSSLGPYGGTNVGPAPAFIEGATMPTVTEPTGLGPSMGNVTLNNVTQGTDLHCDDLNIQGTVVISGQRTILCEGEMRMSSNSMLTLLPGATLDLYVKTDLTIQPNSSLNPPPTSGVPGNVTIYHLGTGEMRVSQPNGVVYATVIAPTAEMQLMPTAEFYGTFIGQDLQILATAAFHADTISGGVDLMLCDELLNDSLGSMAVMSTAGISSAMTFGQWYTEALGISLAATHQITLARDADTGVYTFKDDEFYPLDGLLYGNEGDPHNRYFTFAIAADFAYSVCDGQFIELQGSDDIWLFVNGEMAIDLGGIEAGTSQVIELDRMGLTDGGVYTMHLFYAHRSASSPSLTFRTNLELLTDDVVVKVNWPND